MAQKKLQNLLPFEPGEGESLRWQAMIPLVTNPVLLMEMFQLACVGAAVVLVTLCMGIFITDGILTPEDVMTSLHISAILFIFIIGGFIFISIVFFSNRYISMYNIDASGIYYECSRERIYPRKIFLHILPLPVVNDVKHVCTHGKHLPWGKIDCFHNIPSIRTIVLKRGFWHMLRLYTPDTSTHERVAGYLRQRLKEI